MQITFDIHLEQQEVKQLASILECAENDLEGTLSSYGRASFREYVQMLLGQKIIRQVADVKEYKLLLLIKEVFNNEIPSEQKIAQLFHLTNSQARSLLKSVMAKYRYELKAAIDNLCIKILKGCKQIEENGNYEVSIENSTIVEEFNYQLAHIDGTLPKIMKKTGIVSVYKVDIASYQKLCGKYSVSPNTWSNE